MFWVALLFWGFNCLQVAILRVSLRIRAYLEVKTKILLIFNLEINVKKGSDY